MAVPVDVAARSVGAVEKLHEAHTALDEAAGEDAVVCKCGLVFVGAVGAVEFADVRGLGFQVGRPGHGELHARGEFVAGNARGEVGVIREVGLVFLFQNPQGGAGGFVFGRGNSLWPLQETNRLGAAERRALKRGGQEAVGPVVWAALRHAARSLDRHERGQVLVFAAERVVHPRTHAGKAVEREAGVHHVFRRAVRVGFVGERVQETNLVGQRADVRHEIAHHFFALAAWPECPERLREVAVRALKRDELFIAGQRLAVSPDQFRLVIERVHVAQRAGAEYLNHALGLRHKMCGPRCVRFGGVNFRQLATRLLRQHRGQRDTGKTVHRVGQELSAIEAHCR